jgi:tyrosyl-tRNA synthetase
MIIEYLKKLTFLSKEEIEKIEKENNEHPEKRIAHKALAHEIITHIHSEESYQEAVKISEALFSGDIKSFTENEIKDAFKGLEPFTINEDTSIVDLLVNGGVCSSKREAREFVGNGSISLNGENEETYNKVSNPKIENAYEEVKRFIRACVEEKIKTTTTIVSNVPNYPVNVERCEVVAKSLGAKFRARDFIVNGY